MFCIRYVVNLRRPRLLRGNFVSFFTARRIPDRRHKSRKRAASLSGGTLTRCHSRVNVSSFCSLTSDTWHAVFAKAPHWTWSPCASYVVPTLIAHPVVTTRITQYGVFVELREGVGGMIHISDLSWTKRYSHPSEYTKVGQPIDVLIMEINAQERKLSLSHKQLEENPWDSFEAIFPVGSYHTATISYEFYFYP